MGFSPAGRSLYDPGVPTATMGWIPLATFGTVAAGAGVFCYVLVRNLEPQPEYPALMTDVMRLLGFGIALVGIGIGAVFLAAAASVYAG